MVNYYENLNDAYEYFKKEMDLDITKNWSCIICDGGHPNELFDKFLELAMKGFNQEYIDDLTPLLNNTKRSLQLSEIGVFNKSIPYLFFSIIPIYFKSVIFQVIPKKVMNGKSFCYERMDMEKKEHTKVNLSEVIFIQKQVNVTLDDILIDKINYLEHNSAEIQDPNMLPIKKTFVFMGIIESLSNQIAQKLDNYYHKLLLSTKDIFDIKFNKKPCKSFVGRHDEWNREINISIDWMINKIKYNFKLFNSPGITYPTIYSNYENLLYLNDLELNNNTKKYEISLPYKTGVTTLTNGPVNVIISNIFNTKETDYINNDIMLLLLNTDLIYSQFINFLSYFKFEVDNDITKVRLVGKLESHLPTIGRIEVIH